MSCETRFIAVVNTIQGGYEFKPKFNRYRIRATKAYTVDPINIPPHCTQPNFFSFFNPSQGNLSFLRRVTNILLEKLRNYALRSELDNRKCKDT